jgi:hypothetical protein
MGWKLVIVLLPREPLFLRGGHDLAVDNERRGRIMIERRNAEDRGQSRALCYTRIVRPTPLVPIQTA